MIRFLSKHQRTLYSLLLAGVTLAVFAQTLGYGFVEFDDDLYVTANPNLHLGLSAQGIHWAFTSLYAAFWHPLTWLSLLLDHQLFGMNAAGYHFTNLLLHILNTLLLFHLLARITGAPGKSALVAFLFAVHPLHVESVAWVTERKDTLSTAFWILTMWAYVIYTRRPTVVRYVGLLVVFVLGLMAKPMLVSLPCVLLLMDYWPLRRMLASPDDPESGEMVQPSAWRLVGEKVPLLVLALFAAVIAYVAQQQSGAITPLEQNPLSVRLANSVLGYGVYLARMFWPSGLACFYPYNSIVPSIPLAASAILLAAVSALVVRNWREHPYLVVGWLWYLGTMVPVIGLVRVGSFLTADRFTYVPLIGIFIMAAWGVPDLVRRLAPGSARPSRVLPILSVLLVLILAVVAHRQTHYWRDTRALFEHALAVTEGSPLMHNNLGAVLYREKEIDKAVYHYNEALRMNPDYAGAHNNAGVLLADYGMVEEAIFHYRRALAGSSPYPEAHNNFGTLLFRLGRFEEARAHFAEAVRLQPGNSKARINLGSALFSLGRVDEALAEYRKAQELDPNHAMTYYNIGIALATLGSYDAAVSNHLAALQLEPGDAGVFDALLFALRKKGDYPRALHECRQALAARPGWVPALRNLAWALATRDGAMAGEREEAVRYAEEAVKLAGGGDAGTLDTLAAAYAGAGRFGEAEDSACQALQIAVDARNDYLIPQIEERLQLYEQGLPYIESR